MSFWMTLGDLEWLRKIFSNMKHRADSLRQMSLIFHWWQRCYTAMRWTMTRWRSSTITCIVSCAEIDQRRLISTRHWRTLAQLFCVAYECCGNYEQVAKISSSLVFIFYSCSTIRFYRHIDVRWKNDES